MSLDISQPPVAVPPRDNIEKDQSLGDFNNAPQPREISSSTGDIILGHVDGAGLAAACQEDINPAVPKPQVGEKQPQDTPVVEESTEARLERLGRQRPEVFDSIWSEIGFVFSISMSQVLSVSSPSENIAFTTDLNRNILSLDSPSSSPLSLQIFISQLHPQHGLQVPSP